MIASFRNQHIAGCAAVAATMIGIALFWPPSSGQPIQASKTGPIAPRPLPAGLDEERRLFQQPADPDTAAPPPDAPVLAGIAGRLPDDAVAMIRDDDGRTRIVAIGQTHRGWRLESLSGDAALFRRGTQRVRIALPASADNADTELSEDQ